MINDDVHDNDNANDNYSNDDDDDNDNDNDVYTPHQADLAAEGVAVQGSELGDSLHPGLSHLPLCWDGSRLLEQHRVPDN